MITSLGVVDTSSTEERGERHCEKVLSYVHLTAYAL
jgi:hypothetical protein